MRYFDKGLQEYNGYLKRHLKHQIKGIDKVFSKVSLLDNDAKTKAIRILSNSFENETDKLSPLKSILSELMKSEGNRYVSSRNDSYRHLYNYASINYDQVIWLNLPLPLFWAPWTG
jgi:hypothetical protein